MSFDTFKMGIYNTVTLNPETVKHSVKQSEEHLKAINKLNVEIWERYSKDLLSQEKITNKDLAQALNNYFSEIARVPEPEEYF